MSLQSSEYSHREMRESCGSICKGGLQVDSLPADILAHGLRPVELFGTLGLGRGLTRSGIVNACGQHSAMECAERGQRAVEWG